MGSYPCTGLGLFLRPYIKHSPAYQDIIKTLKNGGFFLDIGCFVGSDIRQLAYDGAPTESMLGIDIVDFEELGFKLFHDRDRFEGKFVVADVTRVHGPDDDLPAELAAFKESKADVIHVSALLHQWIYEFQLPVVADIVLAVSKPGTLFVGHQIGNVKSGRATMGKSTTFMHNQESWKKMWAQIGKMTGQRWEVDSVRYVGFEELGWDPEGQKMLPAGSKVVDWVVRRVQ
jgi:SAM-dependent methyltransferase